METKITVIIPVYNAEQYLKECLDSVLRQSLAEIEVLCIDDGSSDGSAGILKEYADTDKRVCFLHQKNMGVAASRNRGIQTAKGKYVAFMDADDYYPSVDVLEALYSSAEINKVAIAGGEFSIVFPDGKIDEAEKFKDDPLEYGYYFEKEGIIHFRDYQFDYGFHRFLYLRDFLISNSISFPSLIRFQDPPFLVDALSQAKSFYAIKKTGYRYRLKADGVQWNTQKVSDLVKGIKYIHDIAIEREYGRLRELSVRRLLYEYVPVIKQFNWCSEEKNILRDISFADSKTYQQLIIENATDDWCSRQRFLRDYDVFLSHHRSHITENGLGIYYHHLSMGGVQKQIIRCARFLRNMGYNVLLLIDDTGERIITDAKEFKVYRLPLAKTSDEYNVRFEELKRICIANGISTVIYNAWLSSGLLWDELLLQSLNINIIIQTHSIFFAPLMEKNKSFYEMPSSFRYADALVTLTDHDLAYWGIFNKNVYKIPNLLPSKTTTEVNQTIPEHNIIWVGRFAQEKRPRDAILIFASVRKKIKDAKLIMVGDGEEGPIKEECLFLVKHLGLSECVSFLGFIEDMHEVYINAFINLSTSMFEGYGLVFSETMAYGIPSVTYEMSYLELQKKEYGMTIVAQNDVNDAADKCVELFMNSKLWNEKSCLAKNGYKRLTTYDYEAKWHKVLSFKKEDSTESIDEYKKIIKEAIEKSSMYVDSNEEQLRNAKADFKRVNSSISYRLGLMMTWLPRKLFHFVKGDMKNG